jgi:RNA polymerase sigma-70 factor (ECF subfamily)
MSLTSFRATSADDEWGRLMLAAQAGNEAAYRRLLGELTVWLRRYFVRRLPAADVDDAVQDTLLAVHRKRHTYDPDFPLSPWVGAIAKRKWVDQLRTLERQPTELLTDDMATPSHEAAVMSASILLALMNELKPAQFRVIELVKLQGYSLQDASRMTGQSLAAVKVNIHRGTARLKSLIMKNDHVE